MDSCGQRQAISHDIGSASSDRPNVRRLNLRFTAAVDHLEPSNGASILICIAYMTPKTCVAHFAVHQDLDDTPFLFLFRRTH
jgi:hypothetical protein